MQLLWDIDARRRDRQEVWLRWIAAPSGLVLGLLLIVVFPLITGLLPLPRFINGTLVLVGCGVGSFFLLQKVFRFRPRFPWVTQPPVGSAGR